MHLIINQMLKCCDSQTLILMDVCNLNFLYVILTFVLKGFPGLAVYSGTKFYVEGLSQGLRHEMSGNGVKVTCIQPGNVKTELHALATDQEVSKFFCTIHCTI